MLVGVGRELGLPVWAETAPANVGSQKVLERAGLASLGVLERAAGPRSVFTSA